VLAALQLASAALDPATGALLSSAFVPSTLADGVRDVVPLQCGGAPLMAFLDASALHAVALTPAGPGAPETLRGVPAAHVANVALGAHGLLVGLTPDGAGQIVPVNK
jgi:hypothetical protein